MQWASALGRGESLDECIGDAAGQIRRQLGRVDPDLCIVFVGSSFSSRYDTVPALLVQHLPSRHVLGCSGGGVIGRGYEAEFVPAVSVTAAVMPGVTVHPFHLQDADMPDLDVGPDAWERALGVQASVDPHFILLGDGFSFDVENFVMGLDFAFPRATKIGGLASDGGAPGENVLYLDGNALHAGMAGVALSGDIAVETIVAQGCRPIGKPMVITEAQKNVVVALDHKPPLSVLQEILNTLTPRELALMRQALFVGLAMDPSRQTFGPGDFLIRNVIGFDRTAGVLAVGAMVRPGQVIQFHLRDAMSSAEDLRGVLDVYHRSHEERPNGALLFSCLGRGRHLYGRENHDSDMFSECVGDVALGGFFCNGEIGPVGSSAFVRTFVHGYTSCFGVFRARSEKRAN